MHSSPGALDPRTLLWWMSLIFAITIGAMLRFEGLATNPPGMFRDELEKGYTARELWETARHGVLTETGVVRTAPVPLFIDVFGDKTSAIYQYLSAPIVGIAGLNRTTTRMVAALAGIAAILAAAWLGHLWGNRSSSIVAALVTATLPAAIVFSRWAQQGSLVPLLSLLGIALTWLAFWREPRERRTLAILGGLALAIAFYAYDPVRPAIAAIALALVATQGPSRLRTQWPLTAWFSAAFLAITIPVFFYAIGPEGSHRFTRVSVFRDGLAPGLAAAARNYIAHFDPVFLFLTGDANPRHHLPHCGFAALAESLLIPLGLYAAFRAIVSPITTEARARAILVLALLITAPIGAAFTSDGIPHALRAIMLIPAIAMVCAEAMHLLHHRGTLPPPLAPLIIVLIIGHAINQARTGVRALATENPNAWQPGVLEQLDQAWKMKPEGPIYLASEIPYAPYFAIYHENPEPAKFQLSGLLALRTRLLPPGSLPSSLPANAILVAPDPDFKSYSRHDHPPPLLMQRATTPGGDVFLILPNAIE